MGASLDVRALVKLSQAIAKELQSVHEDLGSGTQILRDDAAASGMNCARYIGKIEGLQLALRLLNEVNDEMNGRKTEAA